MRIIDGPPTFDPQQCIVSARDDGQFIDFEHTASFVDPQVYLSTALVVEAAEMLGMVRKEKVDQLTDRVAGMLDEIQQLRDYVKASEQANQLKEAIA
jgi:predicted AlkP superfamily phosphohydrolase/phosphomutase